MSAPGSGLRIAVFGGAGDVGSRAVEELARADGVGEVTIADRDAGRATALAERLASAKTRLVAAPVDANDAAALVALMRGHDVCASALGPFFRFEPKLCAAALEAGVDYASVCDEWDATLAVIERFDAPARAAGRTLLVGLGTSPGLTNVGVRHLAAGMDTVERVRVSVYQPLDAGGGEAVIRHMLHIMTGDVQVWRDGRRLLVPACSESLEVEFPRFGAVRLWNMGHAEPVTLPRAFPGLTEASFFMGYGRGARALVVPARLGLFRGRRATEAAVRLLGALERLDAGRPPAEGAVRLDVWGRAEGREVHRLACGTGQMREATGISLAAGTLLLARGSVLARGGVLAPEQCLEPVAFIAMMRERGISAYEDLAMTRAIG